MGYRKFAADYMFTGYEMLGKDAVLITDENGRVNAIADAADVGDNIERFNGILCPGFINCHCHLELSHLKGKIPPKTGMVKFLLTVMSERFISESEIEQAIQFEEQFMQEKGIVAVGDICNTTHTLNLKRSSDLFFHNFIEATGFTESSAELRFRQARDVYDKFVDEWSSSSIVPHSPYSISEALFRLIDQHEASSLLSIHNQESEAEAEFFAYASGGFLELYRSLKIDVGHFSPKPHSSLIHCLSHLGPSHSLILVHNVHTRQSDFDWIAENNRTNLHWCLCPNANLYINDRLADVELLRKNQANIVIGTDSLASNIQLNVLEELKTLQSNYPHFETSELLTWATINGADALRISKKYGSFEKGKRPGIVVIHGGKYDKLDGTISRRVL